MRFHSILFAESDERDRVNAGGAPPCFDDLNLDQIVRAVIFGRQDYNLAPFFHTPLRRVDAIYFRQEVMRDLESAALMRAVKAFCQQMREMRQRLPQPGQHYYNYQRQAWFLRAASIYCQAVQDLARDVAGLAPASRGLRALGEFLNGYIASESFRKLSADAAAATAGLAAIRYCLLIGAGRVTVRPCQADSDYTVEVEQTFRKFRHGAAKDYRVKGLYSGGMNHIQAQIIERVARLHPQAFAALDAFHAEHADFLNETVARFDREVQFYLAYLDYIEQFRQAGLSFCYPRLSEQDKQINARDTFDLALAGKLIRDKTPVVTNDLTLAGRERILVVTGPNQSGKTTLARTFGQLHYLASLGCPVPGSEARLFVPDGVFTQFERQEDIQTLRGKLADDLVRIRRILQQATPDSVIIMNEMFSSTTLKDALFLSRQIMARLSSLDALGVWVTFLDELASFNEKTVSLVGAVDPDNPVIRTYKFRRRPPDGLAYALAIAEKHRVTHEWLNRRIKA